MTQTNIPFLQHLTDKQLQFVSSTSNYTMFSTDRMCGKTEALVSLAAYKLMFEPRSEILFVGFNKETLDGVFKKIEACIPFDFIKKYVSRPYHKICLKNTSSIMGVSSYSLHGFRGLYPNIVLVDEISYIRESCLDSLTEVLYGHSSPQLFITGSIEDSWRSWPDSTWNIIKTIERVI